MHFDHNETLELALQRNVKVRFRAQTEASGLATLYGSEHWLRRVFLDVSLSPYTDFVDRVIRLLDRESVA